MIKLTKQNLAIADLCSKLPNRPAITGLNIDPVAKTITATDSYRLITMPIMDDDAPKINNQSAVNPTKTIIMPAETAKAAAKKIKKSSLPCLEGCYFLNNNSIASTDLEITNFMAIDDQFPDTAGLIDGAIAKPAMAEIEVNAKLLADTLKTLVNAMKFNKLPLIKIKITGSHDPILITPANDPTIKCLFLPCNN